MAQVTYQALFRSFPKLCGMTGTAITDANELGSTYGLQVIQARALFFVDFWRAIEHNRLCPSFDKMFEMQLTLKPLHEVSTARK